MDTAFTAAATGLHLIEPAARDLTPGDIIIATDQWATVTRVRVTRNGGTASVTISPLTDPGDLRTQTYDAETAVPALRHPDADGSAV
jgi:hypothetical protein